MPLGKLGTGKTLLAASVDSRKAAYVEVRAKQNAWTKSKMTGLIVQWWLDQGAPAVIKEDHGAGVTWDPAIIWEEILTLQSIPAKSAMPRDRRALSRIG